MATLPKGDGRFGFSSAFNSYGVNKKLNSKEASVYRKAQRYGKTMKANTVKTLPRSRFNGGNVAVVKHDNGVINVLTNVSNPTAKNKAFTRIMPNRQAVRIGAKKSWEKKAMSIVWKHEYKKGSTGSSGG